MTKIGHFQTVGLVKVRSFFGNATEEHVIIIVKITEGGVSKSWKHLLKFPYTIILKKTSRLVRTQGDCSL
jgi:hypothetical protein